MQITPNTSPSLVNYGADNLIKNFESRSCGGPYTAIVEAKEFKGQNEKYADYQSCYRTNQFLLKVYNNLFTLGVVFDEP